MHPLARKRREGCLRRKRGAEHVEFNTGIRARNHAGICRSSLSCGGKRCPQSQRKDLLRKGTKYLSPGACGFRGRKGTHWGLVTERLLVDFCLGLFGFPGGSFQELTGAGEAAACYLAASTSPRALLRRHFSAASPQRPKPGCMVMPGKAGAGSPQIESSGTGVRLPALSCSAPLPSSLAPSPLVPEHLKTLPAPQLRSTLTVSDPKAACPAATLWATGGGGVHPLSLPQ